ncbi:ABC transporter permease [Peterkaempfera sp. SMS 1(5)a]|uniref:ABC transporter permease n=1 Tax=Peterkaempfera podocarpi TaxID=3232308 RepID=UPI00366D1713
MVAVRATALVTELYGVRTGAGVSPMDYVSELSRAVQPLGASVIPGGGGGWHAKIIMLDALAGLLSLMLVVVAGLGVLNSVVLDTRERVRELGVCKALGMTPRQTVASVLASVAGIGLVGVPAGMALHAVVMPLVGRRAGTALPVQVLSVYHLAEPAALGLGGLIIALLGAMLPAGWAARARTAVALRAE